MDARDLVAASEAAQAQQLSVALVEQPPREVDAMCAAAPAMDAGAGGIRNISGASSALVLACQDGSLAVLATVREKSSSGSSIDNPTEDPPAR